MSDLMEFGFGKDDKKVTTKVSRYKGEAGNTDRISFVWWETDDDGNVILGTEEDPGTPKFVGTRRFYVQGVGYFRDKGPEYAKLAGGARSKLQIATIIAVWPTDKDGQLRRRGGKLDSEVLKDVEIVPWVFSADKYDALKRRHHEWPVSFHDITLACTDSQYQKMDISTCKENLFSKFVAADSVLAKEITSKIQAAVEDLSGQMGDIIARDLTLDQIREKMGLSTSSDLGGSVGSDAEVDGMLDDLLDD